MWRGHPESPERLQSHLSFNCTCQSKLAMHKTPIYITVAFTLRKRTIFPMLCSIANILEGEYSTAFVIENMRRIKKSPAEYRYFIYNIQVFLVCHSKICHIILSLNGFGIISCNPTYLPVRFTHLTSYVSSWWRWNAGFPARDLLFRKIDITQPSPKTKNNPTVDGWNPVNSPVEVGS